MKLVMRTLNEYLRQKRIDCDLSQLDVARVLGYASPQFVSNWERGLVSPPLETILVLIGLYKIAPSEIINRIIDETREYLESQLLVTKKRGHRAGKINTRKRTNPRREASYA
jgi:transcriptional regulator with XRE-family HTH domain